MYCLNKMITLYFIFVTIIQGTSAIRKSMPVLLIDTENLLPETVNINTNPFHKMSPESFGDIVGSVEHRAESVVIFVEDRFSAEDISGRDAQGSPYVHIRQGFAENKISYIPKVEEPFQKLKQLFPPIESNVFYLREPVKSFDNFKYYYIFFNDTAYNESRVEKLRRHDSIASSAYYSIRHQTRGPIFGIYTGKTNPHMRMRVINSAPKKQLYTYQRKIHDPIIVTDQALFRLAGVYSALDRGRARAQEAPVVSDQHQHISRRSTTTRLLYTDFELEFDFRYHASRWELSSVILLENGEEVGQKQMGVGAPYGYSYYCAEPLFLFNSRDRSSVVLSEYQVEPLLVISVEPVSGNSTIIPQNAGKDRFVRTVICTPCFPAGILAALALVGLLLGILLFGLATLFNCATNSRYDDANQKPLVIVSEL